MRYKIMETANDSLMRVHTEGYGTHMWSICTLRKDTRCQVTSRSLHRGGRAWRPLTNANNRWHRISEEGMRQLVIGKQVRG